MLRSGEARRKGGQPEPELGVAGERSRVLAEAGNQRRESPLRG